MAAPAACIAPAARVQPCAPRRQGVAPLRAAALPPARPARRRRSPLCVRAAAQPQQTWQPPPGLSIMPWTGAPEQLAALEALQARMAASPYPDAAGDETTLRWFLQDRKLDVDDAEEKLIKMLRWRREFGADLIEWTDVAREAATGKANLHLHPDVSGRPVIIVRAAKHVTGATNLQDSQRLCVHLMDQALERIGVPPPSGSGKRPAAASSSDEEAAARQQAAQQPGGQQVETVLGIFDLRGFTSANADWGFVRFLVDIFFLYYPKRLSQVLFVEAPWVFKPGWEIVRPWLKKYAALVRFVSADEVRREYFTPDTVPEEFAGKGFPPKPK